ncbi:N-terminal acetyltransferase A complex catalytic subunit NAA10-like protein [Tanacetum coccineum]
MDEESTTECHGHITSLAVLRTHRKLGLATKLMAAAQNAMEQEARDISHHVSPHGDVNGLIVRNNWYDEPVHVTNETDVVENVACATEGVSLCLKI